MEQSELDTLKLNFESELQRWIQSIQRYQELLAETTHSARSQDIWEEADRRQEEAHKAVTSAKTEYEEAVRRANFDF
jgi:hypothetical protein